MPVLFVCLYLCCDVLALFDSVSVIVSAFPSLLLFSYCWWRPLGSQKIQFVCLTPKNKPFFFCRVYIMLLCKACFVLVKQTQMIYAYAFFGGICMQLRSHIYIILNDILGSDRLARKSFCGACLFGLLFQQQIPLGIIFGVFWIWCVCERVSLYG